MEEISQAFIGKLLLVLSLLNVRAKRSFLGLTRRTFYIDEGHELS